MNLGPSQTPKSLRILLWLLFFGAVASSLLPSQEFMLSRSGLARLEIWQPITYLFVSPGPLAINTAFYVLVQLYLIWAVGTMLIHQLGTRPVMRLFFASGILGGLIATATFNGLLAGAAPAVYGLMTLALLFHPEMKMLLFLVVPVRLKWLVVILLGINLFAHGMLEASANLAGALSAYLLAVAVYDLRSPWKITHSFDRLLGRLRRPRPTSCPASKIYDIRTGKAVVDDAHFAKAMSEKIENEGLNSLSWREKRRLKRIERRSRS